MGTFDEAEQFIRSSPMKYEESLWQALLVCCKNSNELEQRLMIAEKIRTAELDEVGRRKTFIRQRK